MSVVAVQRLWKGRSGSADEKATREYPVFYQVILSPGDFTSDFITVSNAVDPVTGVRIPLLFSLWVGTDGKPDGLGATCRKVMAHEPDDDCPERWLVECLYSNRTDQKEYGDPNPLLRPSEVEWGWTQSTRVLDPDLNGVAVANSAGQKFDPPVEVDDTRLFVRITRNESSYNPNLAFLYKDAVNSDTFWGAKPGYAKCKPFGGKRHVENGIIYYEVTYEIHFRGIGEPAFQPVVLDQGASYLSRSDNTLVAAADNRQNPMDSVLLNGLGYKLNDPKPDTLQIALDATSVGMYVNDGTLWPVPSAAKPFAVQIDSEVIGVTFQQGFKHYTIVRGQRGTTPAAHTANTNVVQLGVYLSFQGYNVLPFSVLNLP